MRFRHCSSQISLRIEGMGLGWRTPRVDSLKLVNYTITENAHKVRQKISFLLCGCYVKLLSRKNRWGLREPLSSIRLNCQLMTKLETKHILQAQVWDCISTKNEMGNWGCIIKSAKSSTLKSDSFGILLRKTMKRS